MDFTFQREKCLGVQLGVDSECQSVDSECQSDTPTTESCTMTLWQSMNHYVDYTQSNQEPVDISLS